MTTPPRKAVRDWPAGPLIDRARALLGHRVRVWPASDTEKATNPVIEGKVVGIAPAPTLCIVTDDGIMENWQVNLPLDDLGEQRHDPPGPTDNRNDPTPAQRLYAAAVLHEVATHFALGNVGLLHPGDKVASKLRAVANAEERKANGG